MALGPILSGSSANPYIKEFDQRTAVITTNCKVDTATIKEGRFHAASAAM